MQSQITPSMRVDRFIKANPYRYIIFADHELVGRFTDVPALMETLTDLPEQVAVKIQRTCTKTGKHTFFTPRRRYAA